MKTCIVGNIHPKPTKSIQQTQQNIHKPYSTSYFKKKKKTQNPRKSRARNRKYIEKMKKPISFLEDWWRDDEENGGFFREHNEFGRERNEQDNEQSQWAREKWKVF